MQIIVQKWFIVCNALYVPELWPHDTIEKLFGKKQRLKWRVFCNWSKSAEQWQLKCLKLSKYTPLLRVSSETGSSPGFFFVNVWHFGWIRWLWVLLCEYITLKFVMIWLLCSIKSKIHMKIIFRLQSLIAVICPICYSCYQLNRLNQIVISFHLSQIPEQLLFCRHFGHTTLLASSTTKNPHNIDNIVITHNY